MCGDTAFSTPPVKNAGFAIDVTATHLTLLTLLFFVDVPWDSHETMLFADFAKPCIRGQQPQLRLCNTPHRHLAFPSHPSPVDARVLEALNARTLAVLCSVFSSFTA